MMTSPFDQKNKLARLLDRMALRALLLGLCVLYFFFLFRSGLSSLLAGGALYALLLLALVQLEKRTLSRRDRLLRERVSGVIALDNLLMAPSGAACRQVRDVLCRTLGAAPHGSDQMLYDGETWLVRLSQCLPGTSVSQGDVLSAHRARIESGAQRCALAATSGFSPDAVRASEWADPPVRLISGRQLAMLFGRLHPASDEEIAAHLARQKKPFSLARIRALALSPAKQRRYLLCAALLLALYFAGHSPAALLSGMLSFVLAALCGAQARRSFRL